MEGAKRGVFGGIDEGAEANGGSSPCGRVVG